MEAEFETEDKSKIKLVENSFFFATIELRSKQAWLVWGNPNCTQHNESLLKPDRLKVINHCLNHYLDKKDPENMPDLFT